MDNKGFIYELENKRYEQCDNYSIEIINSDCHLCYIFCSSNGIYTNINESNYKDYLQKDYYEWKNVSKNKAIRNQAGMYIFYVMSSKSLMSMELMPKLATSIN